LRDVQQFRGACEAARAASHFKGFERIQRGHFAFQGVRPEKKAREYALCPAF
jgi:hypothetical protein